MFSRLLFVTSPEQAIPLIVTTLFPKAYLDELDQQNHGQPRRTGIEAVRFCFLLNSNYVMWRDGSDTDPCLDNRNSSCAFDLGNAKRLLVKWVNWPQSCTSPSLSAHTLSTHTSTHTLSISLSHSNSLPIPTRYSQLNYSSTITHSLTPPPRRPHTHTQKS